jgi:hypothetical protein
VPRLLLKARDLAAVVGDRRAADRLCRLVPELCVLDVLDLPIDSGLDAVRA